MARRTVLVLCLGLLASCAKEKDPSRYPDRPMRSAVRRARKAPASQCRRLAPKTTARSVAATGALMSTSASPIPTAYRRGMRGSAQGLRRRMRRLAHRVAAVREARLRARPASSVDTPKHSTAVKLPARASAPRRPPCAPRSGRRCAAVTGATTATTAWRTPTAPRSGTAAFVRTQHWQPLARRARSAG
jgi:hypothetical protein